jgi:hypothetical protein
LQAILLFSLVILVVFILAVLTGAFGGKNTVTSAQATATASAQAGLSGIFSGGDGSSVLSGTITAGSPTAISLTPGTGADNGTDSALSGASGTSNGDTTGSDSGSQPGGSASGDSSGDGANGSLPGGTNSNPSGASGDANGSSTGGPNDGATGSSTGGSNGSVAGTGNSGLAGSLPGGTNGNASSGANGDNSASSSGDGTASGSNGSDSGSLPGGTNSNTTDGSTGGQTGSNSNAANLPSPHLGNYVCATNSSGSLVYQSDFTILEGLKYKHSSNPSQEFSFSYNPNPRIVTWLDGPNAGTVGTFYLPDGADTYKIVEQFPNNPQAAPLSCMLAEK